MDFIPEPIQSYAEKHTSPASTLLQDLFRFTHSSILQPRMISGPTQGRFLSMMSKLLRPDYILELGTYTGYSALCLAEGLSTQGVLHTIDCNDELRDVQEKYIAASDYAHQIVIHTGMALELLHKISVPHWDLVFIDADKENYSAYYEAVRPKMRKGGVILADNVLWSGKVTQKKELLNDLDTQRLHDFNQLVMNDEGVDNLLLPFRDGIMMAIVK